MIALRDPAYRSLLEAIRRELALPEHPPDDFVLPPWTASLLGRLRYEPEQRDVLAHALETIWSRDDSYQARRARVVELRDAPEAPRWVIEAVDAFLVQR